MSEVSKPHSGLDDFALVEKAITSSEFISECAGHQEHLDVAERAARDARPALMRIQEQLETSEQDWDRLSRKYDGLHDELMAVKKAAEWEQEHGGCFCRTCNEAVGASSPASERVPWGPDHPSYDEMGQ